MQPNNEDSTVNSNPDYQPSQNIQQQTPEPNPANKIVEQFQSQNPVINNQQPVDPVNAAPVLQPSSTSNPQVAPQPQPASTGYTPNYTPGGVSGYIKILKTLFSNPKSYFDSPPTNFVKAIIFPGINLGILAVATLVSSLIIAITSGLFKESSAIGEYFGGLVKNIGLVSLYASLFIFAIAGIIMIFALVSKKDIKFSSVLSMSSIFSLNFLALSASLIIGLISTWVSTTSWLSNQDLLNIINLISNIIVSLTFVYAGALIAQGISTVTDFNLFKSTVIYVISALLMIFILGKMMTTFSVYFDINFGGYSNGSSSLTQYVSPVMSPYSSSDLKAASDFMESF